MDDDDDDEGDDDGDDDDEKKKGGKRRSRERMRGTIKGKGGEGQARSWRGASPQWTRNPFLTVPGRAMTTTVTINDRAVVVVVDD